MSQGEERIQEKAYVVFREECDYSEELVAVFIDEEEAADYTDRMNSQDGTVYLYKECDLNPE